MDHINILKRAFHITRFYRALWIFGILLALTSGGGGSSGSGSSSGGGSSSGALVPPSGWEMPSISRDFLIGEASIIIAIICLVLFLIVITTIVRYISETALIRMVNLHEDSGEKVSVRHGFRLGWSRPALRIFLIDLLIGLAAFAILLLLLAVAAAPMLLWLTENDTARAIGMVIAIGLAGIFIFLAVIVIIALSLLIQFIRRACILEDLSVNAAFRRGLALVGQRLGDVLVMGLLMFGLGLGYAVLMIPLVILILLASMVIAGLPALLVAGVASLALQGNTPWILAAVVGGAIFLPLVLIAFGVIGGWIEVFKSSVWTLTYREILALESASANEAPPDSFIPTPAA